MSTIAFYAPMKPPTHPTPSGDREVARGLLEALKANDQGWSVDLASSLRIYDGKGDPQNQDTLIQQAATEAGNLTEQGRSKGWRIWFTYHNYYKAPDLIGPAVSKALKIPYVLLEATRARKRLTGPWADFARLAEKACDHADVILYFTQRDRRALEDYATQTQRIIHLPPFLAQSELTELSRAKPKNNVLLSVGMFRHGAKFQSYTQIAEALKSLKTSDWHLNIAGDGPARAEIETLFKPFSDRVTFLGQLNKTELAKQYAAASIFFWPGVDEAFGVVYLEAQAAGLPVVAQDLPGVRDVIAPTTKLSKPDAPDHLAAEIDRLFQNDTHWKGSSHAGTLHIKNSHLLGAATNKLVEVFSPLIGLRP